MKYSCYQCSKEGVYTELSSNIDERFIAIDGKCLCEAHSKNIEPCREAIRSKLKQYENCNKR